MEQHRISWKPALEFIVCQETWVVWSWSVSIFFHHGFESWICGISGGSYSNILYAVVDSTSGIVKVRPVSAIVVRKVKYYLHIYEMSENNSPTTLCSNMYALCKIF